MSYDATAAYRTAQVTTANPAGQVVLLYEGAIRFTVISITKLEAGDRQGSHQASLRAQAIVSALRESLDMRTGEIAARLDAIYDFITRLLVAGNLEKNPAPAKQALPLLRELLEAWRAAAGDTSTVPKTVPAPGDRTAWQPQEVTTGGREVVMAGGLRA